MFSKVLYFTILIFSNFIFAKVWYIDNSLKSNTLYSGESWEKPWTSFSQIDWPLIQKTVQNEKVYIYLKKDMIINEQLTIKASGASNNNRLIITTDSRDKGKSSPVIQEDGKEIVGVVINGSYVTIKDIEITRVSQGGIIIYKNSNNVIIEDIEIHDIAANAIVFRTGCDSGTVDGCLIYDVRNAGNTATDGIRGGGDGFKICNNVLYNICSDGIESGGTNLTVYGNDISKVGYSSDICMNSHPDAFVSGAYGLTAYNNYIHDVPSQGMYFVPWNCNTGNILVYNNVFYNVPGGNGALNIRGNAEFGFNLYGFCRILNNSFINCINGSMRIRGDNKFDSITVSGNLLWNNGSGIRLNSKESAVFYSDYNNLENSVWNGSWYLNLESWQNATNCDLHSLWKINPKFKDLNSRNYELTDDTPLQIRESNGLDNSKYFSVDMLGRPRIKGSWSMGALQYIKYYEAESTIPHQIKSNNKIMVKKIATNSIEINIGLKKLNTFNFKIFDISGKLLYRVRKQDLSTSQNKIIWRMRKENLSLNGIYILKLESNLFVYNLTHTFLN